MRWTVLLLLIPIFILAIEAPLDVKPLLEDMCSLRLLPTMSYTSILKKQDSSDYEKAIAWMNLLYFSKALDSFKKSGKREADFFITRIEALTGNEKSLQSYLQLLPDTPCGEMEKMFVQYVSGKKVDSSKMEEIFRSNGGDFFAFEYLYVRRGEDLVDAIKTANKHIRGIPEIVVDYDFTVLKRTYYPLLLLTAGMLYEYAVSEIEDVFEMSLEDFLKMDDVKRGRLVFEKAMFGQPRRVKTARAALEKVLELLSYNSNDYHYLNDISDPPSLGIIGKMSFGEFIRRVKTLISILKLD